MNGLAARSNTAFSAEKRHSPTGPYTTNRSELSSNGVQQLIRNAIARTERYRLMKQVSATKAEIEKEFHTPYKMDVFAYVKENGKYVPGTKTVTMTPYDSLMYMKSILRIGVMAWTRLPDM